MWFLLAAAIAVPLGACACVHAGLLGLLTTQQPPPPPPPPIWGSRPGLDRKKKAAISRPPPNKYHHHSPVHLRPSEREPEMELDSEWELLV